MLIRNALRACHPYARATHLGLALLLSGLCTWVFDPVISTVWYVGCAGVALSQFLAASGQVSNSEVDSLFVIALVCGFVLIIPVGLFHGIVALGILVLAKLVILTWFWVATRQPRE